MTPTQAHIDTLAAAITRLEESSPAELFEESVLASLAPQNGIRTRRVYQGGGL